MKARTKPYLTKRLLGSSLCVQDVHVKGASGRVARIHLSGQIVDGVHCMTTATPGPATDASWFRRVLGQYPTGVVVVTATGTEGTPYGLAVGSFTSVSLDPPMVAFLPDKSSSSWPQIQSAGRFCVNVLGAHQEQVCRRFAAKSADRFTGLSWRPAGSGSPILEDVVAWFDCDIETVHEAGDHFIVLGRVRELNIENPGLPLLFFQGGYGRFTPLSLAAADADLVEQLRLVDLARDDMERIATDLRLECIASALVGRELVLVAGAGRPRSDGLPSRVGQRLPFAPPLGTLWAAHASEPVIDEWLRALGPEATAEDLTAYRSMLESVRQRGYSIGLGVSGHAQLEAALARQSSESSDPEAMASLRRLVAQVGPSYEAGDLAPDVPHDVRAVAVPVFGPDNQVVLVLSLYGLPPTSHIADVEALASTLMEAAARLMQVLCSPRTTTPQA